MTKTLLYFGCFKDKGHFLYDEYGSTVRDHHVDLMFRGENMAFLKRMDAVYTYGTAQRQSLYNEVIIGNFRILAWWDRSVDTRPGSNSALIGRGYSSDVEMLADYSIRYPHIAARQPMPTKIQLQ